MLGTRNNKHEIAYVAKTISAATIVYGPWFDCRGYGCVEFTINNGVPASGGTVVVKVQEAIEDPATIGSPLASDISDVADATTGTLAAAGKKVIQLNPAKRKAFMRLGVTDAVAAVTVAAQITRHEGQRTQPETVADVVIGFD